MSALYPALPAAQSATPAPILWITKGAKWARKTRKGGRLRAFRVPEAVAAARSAEEKETHAGALAIGQNGDSGV